MATPWWKDKVSNKLSNLLSDSPSSSSPTFLPQARKYSMDGKYLSSAISFILPSTNSNEFRSNNHQHQIKPIQSLPVRWRSKSFSWGDMPLDNCMECDSDKEGALTLHEEDGKQDIVRSKKCGDDETFRAPKESGDFDVYEDGAIPHSSEKSTPKLTHESLFISLDLYQFFQSSLPNLVKGCQWVLLYSTVKHGISLQTLIRKSADLPGPCLLIAGDMRGAVFGGLLECPLRPTVKRKYQGTNQTFVFTTRYGEPRLYRPTGANRYFYLCLKDLLALGGGGNFALRLDGDLFNGSSGPCDTYGNLCLAHTQEFELKNVELWGFTHSSRYIT